MKLKKEKKRIGNFDMRQIAEQCAYNLEEEQSLNSFSL